MTEYLETTLHALGLFLPVILFFIIGLAISWFVWGRHLQEASKAFSRGKKLSKRLEGHYIHLQQSYINYYNSLKNRDTQWTEILKKRETKIKELESELSGTDDEKIQLLAKKQEEQVKELEAKIEELENAKSENVTESEELVQLRKQSESYKEAQEEITRLKEKVAELEKNSGQKEDGAGAQLPNSSQENLAEKQAQEEEIQKLQAKIAKLEKSASEKHTENEEFAQLRQEYNAYKQEQQLLLEKNKQEAAAKDDVLVSLGDQHEAYKREQEEKLQKLELQLSHLQEKAQESQSKDTQIANLQQQLLTIGEEHQSALQISRAEYNHQLDQIREQSRELEMLLVTKENEIESLTSSQKDPEQNESQIQELEELKQQVHTLESDLQKALLERDRQKENLEFENQQLRLKVTQLEERPPEKVVEEKVSYIYLNEEGDEMRKDNNLGFLYAKKPKEADDLELIVGISSSIKNQLHKLGIYRFNQIAKWKKADIDYYCEKLETNQIAKEEWKAQAKALHDELY